MGHDQIETQHHLPERPGQMDTPNSTTFFIRAAQQIIQVKFCRGAAASASDTFTSSLEIEIASPDIDRHETA